LRAVQTEGSSSYVLRGPGFDPATDGDVHQYLTDVWRRCSIQMARLCRANGIEYYHFLQPNQYVPGSKPMGAEERAVAFNVNHVYRRGVEIGYPLLIAAGPELNREGVRFVDLTQLFAGDIEPAYVDDCCHLDYRGYAVMARRMAQEIAAGDGLERLPR
jgi:hypothetical protein